MRVTVYRLALTVIGFIYGLCALLYIDRLELAFLCLAACSVCLYLASTTKEATS